MTKTRTLHKRWVKDPKYWAEYEKLGPEFELAQTIIEVRARAELTKPTIKQLQ